MIIKVGDKVEVKRGGSIIFRDARILQIDIKTSEGTEVKTDSYDTRLDYFGTITYLDVTYKDKHEESSADTYWARFNQIINWGGE